MSDINAITSNDPATAVSAGLVRTDTPKSDPTSLSFDDFLDMINPLEHIPIASSIYRAVTGENINPLARIAGDALYGGIFGLASAGISALGALGDEIITASNGGKSVTSTVVAALFGGDNKDDSSQIQLADASNTTNAPASVTAAAAATTSLPASVAANSAAMAGGTSSTLATPQAPNVQVAALQTPARQSPILQIPSLPSSPTQIASATDPYSPQAASDTPVLDTSMVQNAMQNQALALSLLSGHDNLQNQHALRNSRFATATGSSVTAATRASASLPLPGDTPMLSGANNANSATAVNPAAAFGGMSAQNLSNQTMPAASASPPATLAHSQRSVPAFAADMKAVKGLGQYRRAAQSMPVAGAAVDVAN